MINVRGIILAAGRGSRMGELTEHSHKCLTILDGKSLLDWQLSSIKQSGINDITVVTGYKSSLLKGDFKKIKNSRWNQTNMVSSLFCCDKPTTDTIVSYSDIVYSSTHVRKLIDNQGDIVITSDKLWLELWSIRFENPLDDAESFKTDGDNLIEIGNKADKISHIKGQFMGLLKFSPKGWDICYKLFKTFPQKKQDKLDMTTFLSYVIKFIKIKIIFIDGMWCEIDSLKDLNVYKRILDKNNNWSHDWRR